MATKSFDQLVKEKGSVAAALSSQGYTKNDSGVWSKSGSSGSNANTSTKSGTSVSSTKNSTSATSSKDKSSGSGSGFAGSVYGVTNIGAKPGYTNKDGVTYGESADMSRRQDLAGSYAQSGGYTVFYDKDGYATKAIKGSIDYTPHTDVNAENGSYNTKGAWTDNEMLPASALAQIQKYRQQMLSGEISSDQANQLANQIRSGYGYTIDKNGTVTDLGALTNVDARRQQLGLPTNGVSAEQQNYLALMYPEGTNGQMGSLGGAMYGADSQLPGYNGYGSFEDFMDAMGYDAYAEQTRAAIQAAVQNAINGYNQQIQSTNDDTKELARQAYINKMLGQKNLDQQMAANGYAGGMADSQRIATEANYENQLNELEMQRAATVKELESAITNAQLTGDMQTAQELASYLQQIQGQWSSYVQNQQALENQNYWNQKELDNQNYWNQQSLNAQNVENAYTRALNLLAAGLMPDESTLNAAGITKLEAQSRLNQIKAGYAAETAAMTGSGTTTGTTAKSSGGGYNNGSLTTSQVKQMQQALGVKADGMWGSQSQLAAGGLTADQAWSRMYGGTNSTGGNGLVGFSDIKRTIQQLMNQGDAVKAQNVLNQYWSQMSDVQKAEIQALANQYQ